MRSGGGGDANPNTLTLSLTRCRRRRRRRRSGGRRRRRRRGRAYGRRGSDTTRTADDRCRYSRGIVEVRGWDAQRRLPKVFPRPARGVCPWSTGRAFLYIYLSIYLSFLA